MNVRTSFFGFALAFAWGCDAPDDDEPDGGLVETDGADEPGIDASEVEGVCTPGDGDGPFADCIESFEPGPDAAFGHEGLPDIVLGPPVPDPGGGGSLDVASLGCGGVITLFFDPPGIVDGPGDDFVVFENPFATGDETFAEPARVLVSDDGRVWFAFDCQLDGQGTWPPAGCAGVNPVIPIDADALAADPTQAGGDGFDLADVGLSEARYVRLVDVSEAHYGGPTWCTGSPAGFDLDAIAAVPR
ncbi:MAG: cell surface protein [Myxococcota bacterium]